MSRWQAFASADELRAYRKAAGWTQATLAEKAGVHVQTIKYHEARSGPIAGVVPRRLLDLFKALGVEPRKYGEKTGTPTCGARTRSGKPCAGHPVAPNGRCRFHGGKSTGPKSAEGRARIAEAQRRRWQKQREASPAAP